MGRARRLRYRHLRRTIIAVLVMVAVLLLIGLIGRMLLSAPPTRRLARSWIEAVAAQRGIELEIADLSWGFLPPRVQLEGIRLEGPGVRLTAATAEAELARVRITRRTIELGTVAADRVRISLDQPDIKPQQRRRGDLKVTVRHLELSRVAFEGSGLPGRIDLTAAGMNAGWSSDGGIPTGFVRIDRIGIGAPGIRPFAASVAARLWIDDGIRLPAWTVTADGVALRGNAVFNGIDGTAVEAAGTIDLAELDRVVKAGGVLEGEIAVAAELRPATDEPLRAEISSASLSAAGFPLEDVSGTVVLADGSLRGILERAVLHGGRLDGDYTLSALGAPFPHSVRIRGRGVEVPGLLESIGVPPAGITAALDADVELDWNGRALPLGHGRADAVFRPGDGPLAAAGPLTVELKGDRALTFDADGLTIGGSVFSWQGPLAIGTWEPSWSITANPAVLAEIGPMVNEWIGSRAVPAVAGAGRLQVSLSGPWRQLVVNARLDAQPLSWSAVTFDHVVTAALIGGSRLTLSPSRFSIGNGAGEVEGVLTWDPAAGDDQLALDIRGHRIPIATIAEWIGQPGTADGAFSFAGSLRGPLDLPRGAWAAGLDDVSVGGLELGDGTATIGLADGVFEARAIDFDGGLGGRASWRVSAHEIGLDLGWDEMPLDFFGETITRAVGASSRVRLTATIAADGRPSGNLTASTDIGQIDVLAAPDRWTVNGRLADELVGRVDLERTGDGHLSGNGRVELRSAAGLIDRLLPSAGIPLAGSAGVDVDVDWMPGELPRVSATVDALDLKLQDDPVRLLGPAHFTLSGDGLEVRDLYLGHRDDRVFLRWNIGADGSISGNATGTLDALLLRFLVPEWEPAGRATGVLEMLGSLTRPRFEGIAEIAQGSFRIPGGRTIISGIDGTVLLSEDEVVIDGAGFRFMQGRGTAGGRIARRSGVISLDLAGDISGMRYEVLSGIFARVSGPWWLSGTTDDLHISGDLIVDRATLNRRESPSVLILEWFGAPPAPPGPPGPSLDLRVEADHTIELRSPFVRLIGSASLHVTGTTGRPGLVGKVEFEEGGEVTLQNLRYDLERGAFTFADPDRIDPSVELQLRTWVQNYQVTLRVTGTSDRLVPQVSSNPPLPQEEVYSLLAMGYRSDAFGSGAMGVGLASTILSQQIASELDRRTKFILPHVRVDPFAESTAGGTSARVTVVQQLAPNWTVTLQSNLSAERQEVIVSRWYLAPGIFLEASRQLDGSYGVDIKVRRPY